MRIKKETNEKKETRSKFNVTKDKDKRTYEGVVYDSVSEMKYYKEYVCPRLESGEIEKCERQITYELQPAYTHNGKKVLAINYVADFVLTYPDGKQIVVDVKGMPDSVAKLKRKMFWFKYPDIDYIWVSYCKKDGGWLLYEELKANRNQRRKSKAQKESED